VDVRFGRDFLVEGLQELLELDHAVARVKAADHFASGDVQCGLQAGGAVAFVVVCRALGHAGEQRQDRA
jgi:hypothetical protein